MCEGGWEKVFYLVIVGFKIEWSHAAFEDDRDCAWEHTFHGLWTVSI